MEVASVPGSLLHHARTQRYDIILTIVRATILQRFYRRFTCWWQLSCQYLS